MSTDVTLYHNPRCSKSRQALALLEERDAKPIVVRYLDNPPTVEELRQLLGQMNLSPRDIIRKKEGAYKELNLDNPALDDDALLQAMHNHPILIERPIAVGNGKAALGRPPENVLKVLD